MVGEVARRLQRGSISHGFRRDIVRNICRGTRCKFFVVFVLRQRAIPGIKHSNTAEFIVNCASINGVGCLSVNPPNLDGRSQTPIRAAPSSICCYQPSDFKLE
jgi:hypothetical protein